MAFKNFAELIAAVQGLPEKTGVAVVMAQDEHTLQAVSRAVNEGLISAYLIGDIPKIKAILAEIGEDEAKYNFIQQDTVEDAVACAAKLFHDGTVGAMMKGKLETGQIIKGVLNKDNDLRGTGLISLVGMYESPSYHKLFGITDVAINTYPDLEKKEGLIVNAVDLFHKLGVEDPKVAVLCAVEKLNPKMPETVDADALKQKNAEGGITGCVVEGPISLDLAMVKESADIKGYESPVAGDADILVVPDLPAGNLLAKGLTELGGCDTGGVVLGAQLPIILVSRAAKASDKFNSIALAAYVGRK